MEAIMLDFKVALRTTILVVDNDVQQLELRAFVLKMSGFDVMTASSAAEAVSIMAQQPRRNVDMAVLDYEMPVVNGCVLADYLRARYPELKIILHSGTIGIEESAMSSIDRFVAKGDGIALLLEEISVLAQLKAMPVAAVIASEACLSAAYELV
jgi:CheY-like chemotaxis protein